MNLWDILILLAVAGMVFLALRAIRSGRARCSCGGTGGCNACGSGCEKCAGHCAVAGRQPEDRHG